MTDDFDTQIPTPDEIESLAPQMADEKGDAMSNDLSETLRAAGHPELADALADKDLADQLRARGHDAAATLVDSRRGAQPADEPSEQMTPEQREGQALLDRLNASIAGPAASVPMLDDTKGGQR